MALTPRRPERPPYHDEIQDAGVVDAVMRLFSRADISRIDTNIIGNAIEHAERSGDLSEVALHASNEAGNVLLQHQSGLISTYDANLKLATLASTIRANRGLIGAIVGDTVGTMTTMYAGVAGVATAGGLYWSWTNFVYALTNIQQLAMTPAGAVVAAGAVNNIRVLLPEGGLTWSDYLKLLMNPEVIASIFPTMAEFEQQLADAGKVVKVPEGFLGSILNAGGNVLSSLGGAVNKVLGGTLSGATAIAKGDLTYAHTKMGLLAEQATGSLQATKNMFGGWIMVFVIILIMWTFTHLYRRRSNSSFKENVKQFLTIPGGGGGGPQTPRQYRFKYSNSKKSASKRSAKKVKRSAEKRSVNKVKRSAKRSANKKIKRSAKRSANKNKRKSKKVKK